MVKKAIAKLDSSKASGPDCIAVLVLKNCESELSYILAELLNVCLKENCFPDCWKVSSVVPVFNNGGKRSTAKNYHPVNLLSVVCKVFEKLVNNRILDHLEKCGLFSDIQYSFRSSWSTEDLLTVVCLIELLGFLTGQEQLELKHLVYPRLSTEFGILVFFKSYGFQVRYLALFILFLVIGGFRWFWMENLNKNIQFILKFLKGSFFIPHLSYYTLMTFLMVLLSLPVILLSMLTIVLSAVNVIRHLICGNNYDWPLNLNLTYETLLTGTGSALLILMPEKLN